MDLLRSRGHEVALFSMADPRGNPTPYDRHFVPHTDFKKKDSWLRKAKNAVHAIYSRDARKRIRAMIEDFRPDVAHVRNIYHHLSPSILWELKAQGVPVLYHINDFKLLCPSYNLLSQSESCEACKGGKFWKVVRSECYPGAGARLLLMAEAYIHKWLGTYRECVDEFLTPSQFVRDKFAEHGWDTSKFKVLPHFQQLSPARIAADQNDSLLYFGRLSPEKGVDDLSRAMKGIPHLQLTVAGDGPQRNELQNLTRELGLNQLCSSIIAKNTGWKHFMCPMAEFFAMYAGPRQSSIGIWSHRITFYFLADFRRKKDAICWWKHSRNSTQM
jgi:glycosyltransferase involved in cell wall biosynthesis